MVDALKKILSGENAGLHQAAFLLGGFALVSQFLALIRDKLLAATFGASAALDVYYAAFRIPDFLFVTLGSIVSLTILIPFLALEYSKGTQQTRKFIDSVFTLFLFGICTIAILIAILVPWLVSFLFPGFTDTEINNVISLTRILLFSPVLLGLSNILGSITQSNNKFFAYAISPVFYNVGIIIGIVFLYPVFGISGLAYGVIFGSVLHLLVQIPSAKRLDLLPRITVRPDFKKVKEVILISVPRTITLSISHIAIFILISIATSMAAGSITVFTFAFNLQSVPLSIFGVSYSLAAFPTLSRLFVSGEKEQFVQKLLSSARHIAFWVIPSTILFVVLRAHIVRVVLGSGMFSWNDTRLTAATLALFSISILFQSLVLLFVRALYASGATGKPLLISVTSGFITVISAFGFSRLFMVNQEFRFFMEAMFKVSDVPGSVVMMLAFGFTIGSIFDCMFLWITLSRSWKGFSKPLLSSMYRISASSLCAGFIAYISLNIINPTLGLDTFFAVFTQVCVASLAAIITFIALMKLLKAEEIYEMSGILRKRLFKNGAVSPDVSVT